MIYLYVILTLIVILTILYNLKIKIFIEYTLEEGLIIKFYIFKNLLLYKYFFAGANSISVSDNKFHDFITDIQKIKKSYQDHKTIIDILKKNFFEKIYLHQLVFTAELGVRDALASGILCGTAWAFAGIINSYINNNVKLRNFRNNINIKPLFTQNKLNVNFQCIFSLKLGHIIVAIVKILIRSRW